MSIEKHEVTFGSRGGGGLAINMYMGYLGGRVAVNMYMGYLSPFSV